MRILICHNYYQQPGGEDDIFAAETENLRGRGHDVLTYSLYNQSIDQMNKFRLAGKAMWNKDAAAQVRSYVRGHRAQIVHFHNIYPLISPAAYWSARAEGAAVVQSLHNFRPICPAATLFRDGKPCEKCVGHLPFAAVAHKCYRHSFAASAVSASSLMLHRTMVTNSQVDAFIAPTHFTREKFIAAGFPADRLHVKPNFLDPDPGPGTGDGRFALFAGRLTGKNGIEALLEAWKIIGDALPLKVCGDGPLAAKVRNDPNVTALGQITQEKVLELLGSATMLVVPSLWYDGFGRTIIEAFSRGTPVAGSDLGSIRELVEPSRTGILFNPGDPQDMARKILKLAGDGPQLCAIRPAARDEYLTRFGAARNCDMLLEIYRKALANLAVSGRAKEAQMNPRTDELAAG
jgi:glycosyltransferase involved in cell wall biosynthesis